MDKPKLFLRLSREFGQLEEFSFASGQRFQCRGGRLASIAVFRVGSKYFIEGQTRASANLIVDFVRSLPADYELVPWDDGLVVELLLPDSPSTDVLLDRLLVFERERPADAQSA